MPEIIGCQKNSSLKHFYRNDSELKNSKLFTIQNSSKKLMQKYSEIKKKTTIKRG